MLRLLREGLTLRRKSISIAREIDEGTDIIEISRRYEIAPVTDFQLKFNDRWWLERFFDRLHLSFAQGVVLFYCIEAIWHLPFLPYIISSGNQDFIIGYLSTFFGALLIIIVLLIMHSLQNGLVDLGKTVNDHLRQDKFVAPPALVSEDVLSSNEKLAELDGTYRKFYTKPIMSKTLQTGFDLAFNRSYQIGSGLLVAILVTIMFAARYIFNVLPQNILSIWTPVPEIAFPWLVYAYVEITLLWFLTGMLTWTLFITFSTILQIAGNTLGIRPFEPIKEYFQPIITLTLKISFALMSIFCWFTPYWLFWSALPTEPMYREPAANLLAIALATLVPIIILSFTIPILKMHKGIDRSRERALMIKRNSLDKLKAKPLPNLNQQLMIQSHLIEDYRSIQGNSEWILNTPQLLEILGTVFLPILIFLLSLLLQI